MILCVQVTIIHLQKPEKKIAKGKAKSKAKESAKDSTLKGAEAKKMLTLPEVLFCFIERATHRFGDNKIITSGGNKMKDKKGNESMV